MDDTARLVRSARRLRLATLAVAGLLVILVLLAALLPGLPHVTVDAGGLPQGWGIAVSALSVALLVVALIELARMLKRIEAGELFAPPATRHFRRFAALLLAAVLARILLPGLVGIGLALAQGHGSSNFALDDGDATLLLLGALLFLLARLFDEGARLAEDSRSIV